MLKLVFTHAEVRDSGFGLEVNGKSLEDIISEALGTKAKGLDYNDKETLIETDDEKFHSVEEMEEDQRERFAEETSKAESES